MILEEFPTRVELPVQWGDMDAMQHVNNIVYLRYFETSRIHYFNERLNLVAGPTGIGPILAEIQCRYKFPLTFPDVVIAATRPILESIDEYSVELHQVVYSKRHQRIAAEGRARIVFYDYDALKKAGIPADMKVKLLNP